MAALALLRSILIAIWLAANVIVAEDGEQMAAVAEEGEQAAAAPDDIPMTVTFVNELPNEVSALLCLDRGACIFSAYHYNTGAFTVD